MGCPAVPQISLQGQDEPRGEPGAGEMGGDWDGGSSTPSEFGREVTRWGRGWGLGLVGGEPGGPGEPLGGGDPGGGSGVWGGRGDIL